MEYIEISPFDLTPNKWNSNKVSRKEFDKLKESIKQYGNFKPVIVREIADGYEILGGYHRVEAAKELELMKVPVYNLGFVEDKKAKEISLIDNKRYGQDDEVLLKMIYEDIGNLELLHSVMPIELPEIEELDVEDIKDEEIHEDTEEEFEWFKVRLEKDKYEEITSFFREKAREDGLYTVDGFPDNGEVLYRLMVEKR